MRWSASSFKFPAKISLLLVTATGVAAFSYSDTSSRAIYPFSNEIHASLFAIRRSSTTIFTIGSTVLDYKYSLHGLTKGSDEYQCTLAEVHQRSAKKILEMCEDNKGFYVKAGQFAASLRQLPKEYTMTLSVLQDQAVPCDFSLIKAVICKNLGSDFSDIFLSFDEEPLAAASIAQVHRAVLKSQEEVAVKVQHPGLEQLMEMDINIMSFVSQVVTWVFPEFRFGWILGAFKESISSELDFIQEAKNSERTAHNFRNNKNVKIPRVCWDLTTRHVLTMQFCSGQKVDNLKALEKSGIDPIKVAKALVEVFAEMIFIHGFVHGDPHPGNILVSSNGPKGFTLVLLDHGMYKELDEVFRRDYCRLWKSLILQNADEIQHISDSFGVGSYTRFLPIIFTGRTMKSEAGLGRGITIEEKNIVKQELKALAIGDISSFMESLPPDLLTILRIDGILRSILNKLGAPQNVRILSYARSAVYGLSLTKASNYVDHPGLALDSFVSQFKRKLSYLQITCLLGVLELVSWMKDVKRIFAKSFKILLASTRHLSLSHATR